MEPFATLDELKGRLDWTLDADEEQQAQAALEDASDLARHYGREWPIPASAPRLVRTLVLKACKRFMSNTSGYTQSRAGDETVAWNDAQGENAGTVYFSTDEITMLREIAGKGKGRLISAEISGHGTRLRPGYAGWIPTDGKPFPMFSHPVEPW